MGNSNISPLNSLILKATGNKEFDKEKLFRASDIYTLLNDPFSLWCNYYAPEEEAFDETSPYDELKMKKGIEYEKEWIKEN